MRKASLIVCSSVFGSILLVVACSSDEAGPGIKTGKDASPAPEIDARNPYPSFRDDVVPIVRDSCALAACHSSKESNLGIFLKEDGAQIFAEFAKDSPTATGQKFVVPGDPAKSYLMVKLEGTQASLASSCTAAPLMNCGVGMPPDDKLSADKLETFRKWITEGAKNN